MNTDPAQTQHVPVMLREVLELLDPQPGQVVVDATVGAGGHARAILDRIGATGRLIGIDQDPDMLSRAAHALSGGPVVLVQRNFEDLRAVLDELEIPAVDRILADVGFSSDQLADPRRGFSFQSEGPLDMRLDPTGGQPAHQLVNRLGERELADIFWTYGEERHSRRVARRIAEARQKTPIMTTTQLADLVRACVPRSRKHPIDPATRVFQALRIAVNDELGALERFLEAAPGCLKAGGRIAVISFHSLEDRLVKQAFRRRPELFTDLTRKPLQASVEESRSNPRARSAKLRVAARASSEVDR
jgi:16S rRNA (cytosine1402-N4)-methyltransferase